MSNNSTEIVALIATARTGPFLQRALRSIAAQTRTPDRVVVVADGADSHHSMQATVEEFADLLNVEHLRNRRTAGAAGAWNSGIDHVVRTARAPNACWVAILDDDDEWLPEHVEQFVAHSVAAEVVASGFLRLTGTQPERPTLPPSALHAAPFLVGNPGIQGSNLVVRLDVLLQAGCFDESLKSCTDRDLCVRLADLGARYRAVPQCTVRHYAEVDRPRLSTPGSDAKRDGLVRFRAKYAPRMTAAQLEAFDRRSASLFGVNAQAHEPPTHAVPGASAFEAASPASQRLGALHLIVGVAADPVRCRTIRALLDDLTTLQQGDRRCTVDVVIFENGRGHSADAELHETTRKAREHGLRIYLIAPGIYAEHVERGLVRRGDRAEDGRQPIADARTIVQTYAYALAKRRPGAVVWILDDDMRLDPLVGGPEGSHRKAYDIVSRIEALKQVRVSIGIGPYTGSAPLPRCATVRTQLVDVVATLRALVDGEAPWHAEQCSRHNTALRSKRPSFYYDYARRHTDRLEAPIYAFAAHVPSLQQARELAVQASRVLAGQAVTRPLLVSADAPLQSGTTYVRGGNTLIFDVEALAEVPNLAPTIGGRGTRRSDMLWAWRQSRLGRPTELVAVPVFQDRELDPIQGLDVRRLVDDIRGYALATALVELADAEPSVIARRAHKLAVERVAAVRLSFFRILGLARTLRRLLATSWLGADGETRSRLSPLCDQLEEEFATSQLERIVSEVGALDDACVAEFIGQVDTECATHRGYAARAPELAAALEPERQTNLRALLVRALPELDGVALEVLGSGVEGVVFSDGRRVFKVVDYDKGGDDGLLVQLPARLRGCRSLVPVEAVRRHPGYAVIVYPYFPSKPYSGGYGPGLVDLMHECRERGIVCRNIHPDNLRLEGERVRLVDYGSDLRPFTEAGFEQMCRRAWLSFRWAHLPDLKRLMRRSLTEAIPHMFGFERFWEAVQRRARVWPEHDRLGVRVASLAPRRVLDFGCGKGPDLQRWAGLGADVVGYEPDPTCFGRLNVIEGDRLAVTSSAADLLLMQPFDVVVCRRVFCVVESDYDLQEALRVIRGVVHPSARVLVTVCHPDAYRRGDALWRATAPEDADPECGFEWSKVSTETGNRRRDVHRTDRALCRAFRSAGFRVEDSWDDFSVDLERFERVATTRTYELVPMALQPAATLMIKACAMEADTLVAQVRHLVDQLESPRSFDERLLVLDRRTEGFVRQYAIGDLGGLARAANQLLREGYVDRLVWAPEGSNATAALLKRWFDGAGAESHAGNGQPLAATLAGFEAVRSRFVLQVDADVMVGRLERGHDYLSDMLRPFLHDERAVTVAMPIAASEDRPFTAAGRQGAWRVEVRACLLDLENLRSLRPLPRHVEGQSAPAPWHRALDSRLRELDYRSYRGGDPRTFFVHPRNSQKLDVDGWMFVLDRLEGGHVPACQHDHVDLVDSPAWRQTPRSEPYIFVICGRNVEPGRFHRCLDSLLAQRDGRWGAVVIDDASTPSLAQAMREAVAPHAVRITYLRRRARKGLLANTAFAVRTLCRDPDSVIITLDADDALLTPDVVGRVAREYADGADLAVGGMLRTDKYAEYPVDFDDPRGNRGGNVWQHLRTFRKRLFDAIVEDDLVLEGSYADLANDWAYMLPMAEMARDPRHLDEPLYLHEPSTPRTNRPQRERTIARILAKQTRKVTS